MRSVRQPSNWNRVSPRPQNLNARQWKCDKYYYTSFKNESISFEIITLKIDSLFSTAFEICNFPFILVMPHIRTMPHACMHTLPAINERTSAAEDIFVAKSALVCYVKSFDSDPHVSIKAPLLPRSKFRSKNSLPHHSPHPTQNHLFPSLFCLKKKSRMFAPSALISALSISAAALHHVSSAPAVTGADNTQLKFLSWEQAHEKASATIATLNTQEKTALVSGVGFGVGNCGNAI